MSFPLQLEEGQSFTVGQIIQVGWWRYKVTKVGKTVFAITSYYWFDAAWDWFVKKRGG